MPTASCGLGTGLRRNRIGCETRLRLVDAILTGIHQPGESHFELLRAFANEPVLNRISAAAIDRGYREHEFGDSMLIERQPSIAPAFHRKMYRRI